MGFHARARFRLGGDRWHGDNLAVHSGNRRARRDTRREFSYEAMIASGRNAWSVGDRVRVYRSKTGAGAVVPEFEDEVTNAAQDPRDYDVEHYVRVLRDNFASRMARAFRPDDFDTLFADPAQPSLFAPNISSIEPLLTRASLEEIAHESMNARPAT